MSLEVTLGGKEPKSFPVVSGEGNKRPQASSEEGFLRAAKAVKMSPQGVTVSTTPVPDFERLSVEEATQIIYTRVIGDCEAKGVKLSRDGNLTVIQYPELLEKYESLKLSRGLFDVGRVQRAFAAIPKEVRPLQSYRVTSGGLKHHVEAKQEDYLARGDLIVAMLLRGYGARFGKQTEGMKVDCDFKATVVTAPLNHAQKIQEMRALFKGKK